MNEKTEQSGTKLQHTKDVKKQTYTLTFTVTELCITYIQAFFLQNSKLNVVSDEANVNIESILHNKSFMR